MNLEFEECLKKQKIKKFSRGESYPSRSKEGAEKISESAEMFLKKAEEILKEK
jgi:uncharacterized protein (UPF0332 family)